MSKAEEFIKEHTRNCSNTSKGYRTKGVFIPSYCIPWLTPDQARKAVEIAKEEMIEKAVECLDGIYKTQEPLSIDDIEDFKEAMRKEE